MRLIDKDERVACQGHRIDFADLTPAAPSVVLAEARATCATCPALLGCLTYLETADVAGFAGGMFEGQRETWRARDGKELEHVDIVDVSEAAELRGAILDDLPTRAGTGPLPPHVVALVLRLTNAGFTAEEIVERLAITGMTRRTVNYIRNRSTGGLTAQRKAKLHRDLERVEARKPATARRDRVDAAVDLSVLAISA